jgi:hypothetical protein
MAKKLDFNSIKKPTLEITMKDDDCTTFRVTTPRESCVERLEAMGKELKDIVDRGDRAEARAVYELAAELFNFNLDNIKVTAEDLRDVYRLDLEDMVVFFAAYMDFITEINNAKNSLSRTTRRG